MSIDFEDIEDWARLMYGESSGTSALDYDALPAAERGIWEDSARNLAGLVSELTVEHLRYEALKTPEPSKS